MTALRKRLEGLVVREVDDGTLLLDMAANQIHQLNQTAGFIWSKCDEAASVDEIAASLARRFDVGKDIAMRDVSEILRRFRTLNLIEEARS